MRTARVSGRLKRPPARLRAVAGAAVLALGALAGLLLTGVTAARDGVHTIRDVSAPRAAVASDLSYALADMDAQLANVLLVGHDDAVGNKQVALRQLREDRTAVGADLDSLLSGGSGGTAGADERQQGQNLIASLGVYDGYAAQAQAADDQVLDRPAGQPPATAITYYTDATWTMHDDVLPAATALAHIVDGQLDSRYGDDRSTVLLTARWAGGTGLAVVAGLVVWQVFLARRYRRVFNPALVLATATVAAVTWAGTAALGDHADTLRSAKAGSFTTFARLTDARALAADANADESRFIVLPDFATYYQGQVDTKDAELADVASAGLAPRLTALRADDTAVHTAVVDGRLDEAVDITTQIARGRIAFDFFDYQSTLADDASTAHAQFASRLDDAGNAVDGWVWIAGVGLGAGALLVLVGVRPRVREWG